MPIFALYAYRGGINIPTLLFIRFILAAIFFFIYIFATRTKINVNWRQLAALFIMGGVFYTLQSTLYFTSLKYISPSLTALLLYTYPIIVPLLSYFIVKEKLTKRHFLAMLFTFGGLVLVLGMPSGEINGLGVLMAFGAALVYSCYIILGNKLLQKIPSIVTSAFVTLFAAGSFLTIGSITGSFQFNFGMGTWLPILGIVLFSTMIAILTFFKGMEYTGPTAACIISTFEPLLTIGLSWLFLQEKLTIFQLIGGLAVISGAIIVVWASATEKSPKPDILIDNTSSKA